MVPWSTGRKALVVIVSALALCAGSFAAGRYSQPTRVTTTATATASTVATTTAQVATHVEAAPVKTTTVTRRRPAPEPPPPAGCPACPDIEETTTVVGAWPVITDTSAALASFVASEQASTATSETVRDAPRLTLTFGVGTDLTSPTRLLYQGAVDVRILGPVTLGASLDSTLRAFLRAGVTL